MRHLKDCCWQSGVELPTVGNPEGVSQASLALKQWRRVGLCAGFGLVGLGSLNIGVEAARLVCVAEEGRASCMRLSLLASVLSIWTGVTAFWCCLLPTRFAAHCYSLILLLFLLFALAAVPMCTQSLSGNALSLRLQGGDTSLTQTAQPDAKAHAPYKGEHRRVEDGTAWCEYGVLETAAEYPLLSICILIGVGLGLIYSGFRLKKAAERLMLESVSLEGTGEEADLVT